jgi:starvation-inducible DNA-binding protein
MRRILIVAALATTALTPDLRAGAATLMAQTANGGAAGQRTSQGSDQVKTLSPQGKVGMPQPLGTFPTNTVTNRPYVSPEGGQEGYRQTVGALQRTLTELQQLSLQIKEAHWNVSGTLFYTLHELLQEHYEGVDKYKDMVAERLLAIGSSADGRATTIVKTSALPEIPGGYIDDAQVIAWFTNAYKQVAEEVRAGIKDTEKPDPTTSNLLQTVEDGIDKYQWQMRAFVQAAQTDPNTGADVNGGKAIDLPNQPPSVDPNAK